MNRSVVVICMGGAGHVQLLLPVVAGLASRGLVVHVMTRSDFRRGVENAGGRFVDLFARRSVEAVDAESVPFPSRFVTFAAAYAESVCAQIATLGAGVILYDTFTVVAPVVARRLRIPYVNVCPNHAPVPARMVAALREDRRVATSAACLAAVQCLEEVHGMIGANPFSYYQALSPHLNIYCEPEEFLRADERAAFLPIAFFGSLSAPGEHRGTPPATARRLPLIYVSFGTGVWRYFEATGRAALRVISRTLADRDFEVLISLGGHPLAPAEREALVYPNVRIADAVDQMAVLAEADAFVTHHGINSTHESIFHEVPMLSYPFFGDQPALARRSQELGLAVALVEEPQAELTPASLLSALDRLRTERGQFASRLAAARRWELRTIAGRGAVFDRIVSLASAGSS